MGSAKWWGGILGFIIGGPAVALGGFLFGLASDILSESVAKSDGIDSSERNRFLFSLMLLSADVIQTDGKIMHSEMEYVRRFLKENFGGSALSEGESHILKIFEWRKKVGEDTWRNKIAECCYQLARSMSSSQRIQLVSYLISLAKADNNISSDEIAALNRIAAALRLDVNIVNQLLGLGGNSLDDAYRVLGISKDVTDDEVRKAYKKLAVKYHPDHVASLGEDIRKSAEEKFKEINDARDRIYKSRGMK